MTPSTPRYFCGRERLLGELVARLAGASLLVIVGPSGSGKSSALRAGLLPALASGRAARADGWRQALLRPGERPAARARPGTAGGGRSEAARGGRGPVRGGVHRLSRPGRTHRLLRRDGGRRAGRHARAARPARGLLRSLRGTPRPGGAAAANQVLVGAMRPDELRRAIERPAELAGLRSSPSSSRRSSPTSRASPAGCRCSPPPSSSCGSDRDGRAAAHAAYERSGGVRGAVARLAEQPYARLTPPQQAARRILLRLARPATRSPSSAGG